MSSQRSYLTVETSDSDIVDAAYEDELFFEEMQEQESRENEEAEVSCN